MAPLHLTIKVLLPFLLSSITLPTSANPIPTDTPTPPHHHPTLPHLPFPHDPIVPPPMPPHPFIAPTADITPRSPQGWAAPGPPPWFPPTMKMDSPVAVSKDDNKEHGERDEDPIIDGWGAIPFPPKDEKNGE